MAPTVPEAPLRVITGKPKSETASNAHCGNLVVLDESVKLIVVSKGRVVNATPLLPDVDASDAPDFTSMACRATSTI